jgi:hypothetical protein
MGDFDPDTTAMAAAITQLTGLVQGLQGQMAHMQNHMAAAPVQNIGPSVPASVAAQTATAGQVTRKLKLPQPKPFRDSSTPGAVENFLFDNEQYFISMDVPEDRKVFFASGLLEGATKTWWHHACHVAQEAGTLDTLFVWDTFRTMLMDRFRALNASHHAQDNCLSQPRWISEELRSKDAGTFLADPRHQ